MNPTVVHLSPDEIGLLRKRLRALPEVSLFQTDVKFSAKIASYGIFREVGGFNDELARFIFDADSKQPVRRESLQAKMIEWNNLFGVHIFSTESQALELRTPGFYDVVHPKLSINADGTFHSLYIFPEIIADIARAEGVDLVLVKSWGMNSIFGGFDPSKSYYQTNMWEIENNDVLKFADLARKGQLAFMGTHDLIAHIAGVDRNQWISLKATAEKAFEVLQSYFSQTKKPSVSSLILPYTIGVVLDDLAQPPSYGSASHRAVLDELLEQLEQRTIPPELKTMLARFPASFQKIINLSRTGGIEHQPGRIKLAVQSMVQEINKDPKHDSSSSVRKDLCKQV